MRLIAKISVTAAVAGVAVLGLAPLASADDSHLPPPPPVTTLEEGHQPPPPPVATEEEPRPGDGHAPVAPLDEPMP
ncbi:hypothetical protein [Streptomyces mayteni]